MLTMFDDTTTDMKSNKKFQSINLKYSFQLEGLNKFNQLKIHTKKQKRKKEICMIQFQNYIMSFHKCILMDTIIYHMQKKTMDHKYKPKKFFLN